MSVEERGRSPSKWSQFWFGALHWMSCGLCFRDSTFSALPTAPEDSSMQSPKLLMMQKMQPGALFLTVIREHSSQQIQPDALCLMDLNDDCLLEIIDRLDFKDRLRSRVNRRLNALEPAASAIAETANRAKICSLNYRFDKDHAELESGARLLIEKIKYCRFDMVTLQFPLNMAYLADVFNALRFLKAERFTFTPIGTYIPNSPNVAAGIHSSIRNNELLKYMTLDYPQTWAAADQLLVLVQQIGQQLMGIDPTILAHPPRKISVIRTSIKEKEIYAKRYGAVGIELCLKDGPRATTITRMSPFNIADEPLFNLDVSKWTDKQGILTRIRVPCNEEV